MMRFSDDLEAGLVSNHVSTVHDAAHPQDASATADVSYNLEADSPDGDAGVHERWSLLWLTWLMPRRSRANDEASVHEHPESEEPNATGGFVIEVDKLTQVVRDRDLQALNQYNGVEGLSSLLKSDLGKGIDRRDDEILQRGKAFGSNTYPCKNGKTFWSLIWKATKFPPYMVILLAAVISSLLRIINGKSIHDGFYVEACIISATVLDITLRAFTEYKRCRQSAKTSEKNRSVPQDVIRGGRRLTVSSSDIVVGDIVPLRNGFLVPADGVLFVANSLKIDEQEITGSHLIVQKDLLNNPFLLSGSKVIEGIGTMLVTSVGINTEWGKKIETQPEIDEENPFQVYVKQIAISASWLVISLASIACIVQLCRYFYGWTKKPDGTPMYMPGSTTSDEAMEYVIKSMSFGIETIIVAVPVGLFIGLVLNLAYTIGEMMSGNALVQKLSACKRMGHVTTILCHKTGILTSNEMSVVDVWAGGIRAEDMDNVSQLPSILKEKIIEGIARNTNGSVVSETGVTEPKVYGSPTEQAILSWGNKLGMKFDEARSGSPVLHVIPFNPKKKYGGVALQVGTEYHVHWKGSAKVILDSCKWYMDEANNRKAIDKQEMEGIIGYMCERGMRCAALAYQSYELGGLPTTEEELSRLPQDLVLLAIIGIKDPCWPDTKDAVELCNSGGVKVRMVTEDDALTAQAIAKDCGILENSDGHDVIMTGAQFRNLSEPVRDENAPKILVLAQASPEDSLLFVETLKRSGDVVAAIGMGIHDTKTLVAADVSIAAGIGGTREARENSDIIIMNNRFAPIVEFIQFSRSLYINIQRYVRFRLTVSLTALAICVVVVVLYDTFPLNPVQLLLLNFVLDIFGALALAYRPSARNVMRQPPVGMRDPLITMPMWLKMLIQVINEVEIPKRHQTLKEVLRANVFVVTITATIIVHIILVALSGISNPDVRFDWEKWVISILVGFITQLATTRLL
ncbi:unnamed protein product [Eruca vesicaria subsp. sativa]|uniref:Calcium-transporting ATPase n=1 Tax=Eruca vesicaria subsp. sativa TaxID=29727 RepID=A0ABC8JNH6_ERUVS|nr:unnamed protein product [Eruca vesicaria subsp. sativa]